MLILWLVHRIGEQVDFKCFPEPLQYFIKFKRSIAGLNETIVGSDLHARGREEHGGEIGIPQHGGSRTAMIAIGNIGMGFSGKKIHKLLPDPSPDEPYTVSIACPIRCFKITIVYRCMGFQCLQKLSLRIRNGKIHDIRVDIRRFNEFPATIHFLLPHLFIAQNDAAPVLLGSNFPCLCKSSDPNLAYACLLRTDNFIDPKNVAFLLNQRGCLKLVHFPTRTLQRLCRSLRKR